MYYWSFFNDVTDYVGDDSYFGDTLHEAYVKTIILLWQKGEGWYEKLIKFVLRHLWPAPNAYFNIVILPLSLNSV